jgi:Carboxypeptidase regulatory-like domain
MLKAAVTLVLVLLLPLAVVSLAQQGSGGILGTVTDPSGAPIVGAPVAVTNVATNVLTKATTGERGDYIFPRLPVGEYSVTAGQPGFKSLVRTGVVLQVDQRAEVNLQLSLGDVGEKVEVVGDAPLVNTTNATVGEVIENRRITELPLNGRNALALMYLSPDVKAQAGTSGFGDRGTALSNVSINGGPSSINSFLLDGGTNNQAFLQDLNVNPTVDSIEEFKVQSGAMSAEFGFTLGGVVNMVTKSGTNSIHGSGYEFVRNNDFDARNTFAAGITPYRYNQFGGAVGGPIYIPKAYDGRNKTFFFTNVEHWQYSYANSIITSVPTAAQRGGDFSGLFNASGVLIPIYDPASTVVNPSGSGYVRTVFPGNVIPSGLLDPVSQKLLGYLPLPNRAPTNAFTQANNLIALAPAALDMNQYMIKLDHHFSEKDTMFFRYFYFQHFNNNGGGNIYTSPLFNYRYDHYTAKNVIATETHTFSPTLLNEVHLSLARNYFPFQAASFNTGITTTLGLPPSVPDLEAPNFAGGAGLPGQADLSDGIRGQSTWQLADSLTWVRGLHTLKMGFDVRMQQANNFQPSGLSGTYSFSSALTNNPQVPSGTGSSVATFVLGQVSSASIVTALGESEKGHSFSGFIQDDFRITPHVTLNLGLRYDYQPWATERNNGLSNFSPSTVDSVNGLKGAVLYGGKGFTGSPLGNTEKTAFGPRAGLAWDIAGNSKTVFRAGYGIYYENVITRDMFGNTAGFASTSTSYNPPGGNTNLPAFKFSQGLPTPPTQPLGSALGPAAFLGQGVSFDQSGESVPRAQEWNASLQRQLPGQWVVELGYTGNHANHLVAGGFNLNQLNPTYLSQGTALQDPVANPYAGLVPGSLGGATITQQQSLLAFPYYTSVTVRNPHLGSSIYHAGFVSVKKKFSNGLVLLASYTQAKLISDSIVIPDNFGSLLVSNATVTGYQNGLYNRRGERSLDPTNVAQRVVISGVYELPVGKGKTLNLTNPVANGIFGGWQTQGIFTAQSGLPLVITGANNNLATRPNSTGQSAKLSNPTQYAWFNTSVFVNPPSYTYGNLGRTLPDVVGPGTINIDMSLIKNIHIWERVSLQIRAEAINMTNHVNLGMPSTGFSPGANGLNSSSTFGTITSAAAARVLQFGAKVVF